MRQASPGTQPGTTRVFAAGGRTLPVLIREQNQSYRYVFRLVDLETGMYVADAYSDVSEKAAFRKAVDFVERAGLSLNSVRLDRYYSSRKTLQERGEKVEAFVLPKENLASFGRE